MAWELRRATRTTSAGLQFGLYPRVWGMIQTARHGDRAMVLCDGCGRPSVRDGRRGEEGRGHGTGEAVGSSVGEGSPCAGSAPSHGANGLRTLGHTHRDGPFSRGGMDGGGSGLLVRRPLPRSSDRLRGDLRHGGAHHRSPDASLRHDRPRGKPREWREDHAADQRPGPVRPGPGSGRIAEVGSGPRNDRPGHGTRPDHGSHGNT